jgi:hypothetical protein
MKHMKMNMSWPAIQESVPPDGFIPPGGQCSPEPQIFLEVLEIQ